MGISECTEHCGSVRGGFRGVFTVAQASQYLGMDRDSVYRLLQAGQLNGLKFKQQWRIAGQDLFAWAATPPN